MVGANMLLDLPVEQQEAPLVKVALRFAGGTTKGMMATVIQMELKGEEIPHSRSGSCAGRCI